MENTDKNTPIPQSLKTAVISRFLKRYLCFKPLYWIEKKIDPSCRSGRPKYKRFARFVYKVAKWSL
jgi:hypothetical protein